LEHTGLDRRITLKLILEKEDEMFTEFVWLRIGTSSRLL